MPDSFDFQIAKAVARVRLMERLVHDRGPWFIECEGEKYPAAVIVSPSDVSVFAEIPAEAFVNTSSPVVEIYLWCKDELVSMVPTGHPGAEPFTMQWSYSTQMVGSHS